MFSDDDNIVLKQLLQQRSLKELARKVTLSWCRGHNIEQKGKRNKTIKRYVCDAVGVPKCVTSFIVYSKKEPEK